MPNMIEQAKNTAKNFYESSGIGHFVDEAINVHKGHGVSGERLDKKTATALAEMGEGVTPEAKANSAPESPGIIFFNGGGHPKEHPTECPVPGKRHKM